MTIGKKFKRRVRARMEETGESYTAARKAILAENAAAGDKLAMGDLDRAEPKHAALLKLHGDLNKQVGRGLPPGSQVFLNGLPVWFGPDPVPDGYVRWPS